MDILFDTFLHVVICIAFLSVILLCIIPLCQITRRRRRRARSSHGVLIGTHSRRRL
uniref:Uncharacterized protein n=1 Tax=Arundo donax TaxID=35708 RepID=A0A0A8YXV5_ARUDO